MSVAIIRVFVCMSVCPHDNSKMNKVFKLGIGNDLGMSYIYGMVLRSTLGFVLQKKHTSGSSDFTNAIG